MYTITLMVSSVFFFEFVLHYHVEWERHIWFEKGEICSRWWTSSVHMTRMLEWFHDHQMHALDHHKPVIRDQFNLWTLDLLCVGYSARFHLFENDIDTQAVWEPDTGDPKFNLQVSGSNHVQKVNNYWLVTRSCCTLSGRCTCQVFALNICSDDAFTFEFVFYIRITEAAG